MVREGFTFHPDLSMIFNSRVSSGSLRSHVLLTGKLWKGSPTNHPFRKENDLNQTSMLMFHMFHVNLQVRNV